jgi:hypothetical protein
MKKILFLLIILSSVRAFSQGTDFEYDGTGNVTDVTNWVDQFDLTTNPIDFDENGANFHLKNSATITLNADWELYGVAIVEDGVNFIIPDPFSFVDAFNNTTSGVLQILNSGTVTINSTLTSQINFDNPMNGTVIHNSIGDIISTKYNNLSITENSKLSGDATISSNIVISAGKVLDLGNKMLTANTISCGGTISGSSTSGIKINGSTNSNLDFTPTKQTLRTFSVNCSSPSIITLNSPLTVNNPNNSNNIFHLENATLDLSGNLLSINARTITLGATGFIKGSTTSSLSIAGISATSISGSLNMDQTSAATKALADLTLNRSGASLTLGNSIEIWGAITPSVGTIVTGGNLTLKQTQTVKGRIGEISTGGFSGNVKAETFLLGGSTGWALLGSGGISGQTMNNWYGQFPMSLEGSPTGVTSAGGYFESVQGWNEADAFGYDTTISVSTALTPGKGFWTFLGTGQFTTNDITLTLTGSPVTGNVNIPLTNSAQSGTCLIANPYASPISWTALRNGNGSVDNAIYIYNADGAYASFVGGVGTNGGSDVIPSGQGFFVRASANTNLTAQETNKISSNTTQVMRDANNSPNGLPIKLKINGFYGDIDETAIRFHGSATNAFDADWDAYKIFQTPGYVGYPGNYSKYTTISTKGGNIDYSINSIPYALTQNAVIPVLVKVMATGQYTISGQDMQLLPPNTCVTLKDKLLNTVHNIKASPYVFSINDTTSKPRFELTVCADITAGINNNNSVSSNLDKSVIITENSNGVFVNFNFDKTTNTRISITNILGQKIMNDKNLSVQNDFVFYSLEEKNQLIFVTIESENNKITKKIIH